MFKVCILLLFKSVDQIGEFELCLYDTQPAVIGGAKNEFIFSSRLDNLMMSYCSIHALLESLGSLQEDDCIRIVGLFDNEEVGSTSSHGANSNLLESTIRRLSGLTFGSQWVGETTSVFENNFIIRNFLISHCLNPSLYLRIWLIQFIQIILRNMKIAIDPL